MGDGRVRRLVAIGLALVLLVALLAAPANAAAKQRKRPAKPTLSVKAKLPPLGHAALSHAVFKLRKRSTGKAGASTATSSAKRKVAKIREASRLPDNVLVFYRFSKLRKKGTFAIDLLVINSRRQPGTATASLRKGKGSLQEGDAFSTEFCAVPTGTCTYEADECCTYEATGRSTVIDGDIFSANPARPKMCEELDTARQRTEGSLFGVVKTYSENDLYVLFKGMACNEVIAINEKVAALLFRVGMDTPVGDSCSGSLEPAFAPYTAEEFVARITCTRSATSLAFELPGGRAPEGFIPPQQLPSCTPQQLAASRFWLFCTGGTLPAGAQAVLQVNPYPTQLSACDRMTVYLNPSPGAPSGEAFETSPFGTCP